MKVLVIDIYHYVRGGAERYALELADLLEANGHQAIPFKMAHERNLPSPYAEYFPSYINFPELLPKVNVTNSVKVVTRALYSGEARNKLAQLIEKTQPDIAHVHNIVYALTPSIFYELAKARIPVIQTLHDFKILCPNTLFYRQGEICERCTGGKFYNAIRLRCKRGSLPASIIAGTEAYIYHWLRTYQHKVNKFISPSKFLQQKMIAAGFPEEKVLHLPHMVSLDRFQPASAPGSYGLYYGRLVPEKGLNTLIQAMALCPDVPLKVVGEGHLINELQAQAREKNLDVEFVGYQSGETLFQWVRNAAFVVVPSEWYENSPLACYEPMALARPVIGANIGGIPELVQDGHTGMLFESRNVVDLADKMKYLYHRPDLQVEWGQNARRSVEVNYNAPDHYKAIISIYEAMLNERNRK
jgi:glycosyltransferase involved in cell wall biosynthesis